jgi:Uma2 family endonuclease
MGSTTLVPLAEYLRTSYRPDVDYLEGELLERNMGERPHARLQMYLGSIFFNQRRDWKLVVLPEQRVQVRPNRYRIPDLCVVRRSDPPDPIVTVAPVLCVEVLSSEDTLRTTRARVDDYLAMGVENVWVVDPWRRLAYYATPDGYIEPADGYLRLLGTPVAIPLAAVFAELDETE